MKRRHLSLWGLERLPGALALAATLVVLGLSGCGSEDTAEATRVENLFGVTNDVIGFDTWSRAPAGCNGSVDRSDVTVAWAQGEPALGVLLLDGEILCVDTWESIAAELERFMGDPAPDPMLPEQIERLFEHEGDPD